MIKFHNIFVNKLIFVNIVLKICSIITLNRCIYKNWNLTRDRSDLFKLNSFLILFWQVFSILYMIIVFNSAIIILNKNKIDRRSSRSGSDLIKFQNACRQTHFSYTYKKKNFLDGILCWTLRNKYWKLSTQNIVHTCTLHKLNKQINNKINKIYSSQSYLIYRFTHTF